MLNDTQQYAIDFAIYINNLGWQYNENTKEFNRGKETASKAYLIQEFDKQLKK